MGLETGTRAVVDTAARVAGGEPQRLGGADRLLHSSQSRAEVRVASLMGEPWDGLNKGVPPARADHYVPAGGPLSAPFS